MDCVHSVTVVIDSLKVVSASSLALSGDSTEVQKPTRLSRKEKEYTDRAYLIFSLLVSSSIKEDTAPSILFYYSILILAAHWSR